MATGNWNIRRTTHRSPTLENPAHHFGRDLVDGHAKNRQCQNWLAAHGVDVRDRVSRGDAPEVVRIVDHRHEEISCGDDAGAVVELPDRRIVTRFKSD